MKRSILFILGGLLILAFLGGGQFSHLAQWHSAEDTGYNTGTLLLLLLGVLCIYLGFRTKIDTKEPAGEGVVKEVMSTKKAWTIIGVILLIVFLAVIRTNYQKKSNEQAGKVIKDALTGSQTADNPDQSALIQKFFEGIKVMVQEATPHDWKLAESNLLQVESFESKQNMQEISNDLRVASSEMKALQNDYYNNLLETLDDVLAKDNSNEEFKKGVKDGFLSSYDSPEVQKLTDNKFSETIKFYDLIDNQYEFLITNFEKYTVENDEKGLKQIFFTNRESLDKFNKNQAEIAGQSQVFQQSQQALLGYFDKNYSKYGVSADDLMNYMTK